MHGRRAFIFQNNPLRHKASLLFFDLKFIYNPVKGFSADLLEDNLPDGVVRIARCSLSNFVENPFLNLGVFAQPLEKSGRKIQDSSIRIFSATSLKNASPAK